MQSLMSLNIKCTIQYLTEKQSLDSKFSNCILTNDQIPCNLLK